MSELFEVYQHSTKGAWGFTVKTQQVHTVRVEEEKFEQGTVAAHKLPGEISKRLRMGFTKLPRAKYFKVLKTLEGNHVGSFVDQHPELTVNGGMVLFTPLSSSDNLLELSQKWEVLVEKTDAPAVAVADWMASIESATQYIVAPATHPAFALVLADWAIENKRLLLTDADNAPKQQPKKVPKEWEDWLAKSFQSTQTIRSALEQLGWSLRDALMCNEVSISETKANASDSWFTDASFAAF